MFIDAAECPPALREFPLEAFFALKRVRLTLSGRDGWRWRTAGPRRRRRRELLRYAHTHKPAVNGRCQFRRELLGPLEDLARRG